MLQILPILGTKALLLLITALSVQVSLSPPNPPVKKADQICLIQQLGVRSETRTSLNTKTSLIFGIGSLFEKVVLWVTFCSKLMVWAGVLSNILGMSAVLRRGTGDMSLAVVYLGSSCPVRPDPSLNKLPLDSVGVHPALVVGAMSAVFAALLRVWCFKTLGPFFTFEITIRPKHQLVTSGPYAWVRHPSYTGVYLTLFGASLALWSPGMLTAECASQAALEWTISSVPMWNTWQRIFGLGFAAVWMAKCLFACHGMVVRMKKEDNVLEATFRECWEEYAERVPWKLVPGIW